MEKESLQLNYTLLRNTSLEEEIKEVVEENETDFYPYFSRFMDQNDARHSIIEGLTEASDVTLSDDFNTGFVEVSFTTDFYAGCKDINSTDETGVTLEFEIDGDELFFNITLPPTWGASDVY